MSFNYENAFSRNLGFISPSEQKDLSEKTIVIAGMGGVGGNHALGLARIGFKKFKLADFDDFEEHNFNRQAGASVTTIGKNKAYIIRDLILDIIPTAQIEVFDKGINDDNRSDFFKDADIFIDGLDVYAIDERIKCFDCAEKMNIPAITCAPLGMGASLLTFLPGKMSFASYFQISLDMESIDKLARFVAGINPLPIYIKYLNRERVDMVAGKAPSLNIGVISASAALTSEVCKIFLKRGVVRAIPSSTQVDFFFHKHKKSWIPFGNKNIRQKILIFILKREMSKDHNFQMKA